MVQLNSIVIKPTASPENRYGYYRTTGDRMTRAGKLETDPDSLLYGGWMSVFWRGCGQK
jgi:hypothetical protein